MIILIWSVHRVEDCPIAFLPSKLPSRITISIAFLAVDIRPKHLNIILFIQSRLVLVLNSSSIDSLMRYAVESVRSIFDI